jgi:hypothetical protein
VYNTGGPEVATAAARPADSTLENLWNTRS